MPRLQITDLTLRDAHQSLIATRMRTEDMLPACDRLDQIGFWSLEVWGGATFDACLRFLKEDPWERLRRLRAALPGTPLQMLLRGQNLLGYRHYADDVVRAFVQRAADNGIDVFRIFDALNDVRNLETAIDAVKQAGKHAQGAISYTVSPVHTDRQFVEMAVAMQAMGCDSIAIKDMAGLLKPDAAASLVKALVDALDVPVQLHTHATSGLAEMCQLKAVENGCATIDTALSSWAGGASHPPTESMVAAFKGTAWDTGLDLRTLQELSDYFRDVRKKYHQFESEHTGVDTRALVNQVPGGMISNLVSQLRDQQAEDRLDAVLAEIPRVREDLGYPPLVTPTSQIVGTQAVLNVLTGERYKTITNEVKLYLKGHYGRAPGPVSADPRRKAIGDEAVIDARPADLLDDEMERLRGEIADLAESEEDVMIYAMFPDIGREFLQQRRTGRLTPEPLLPPNECDDSQNSVIPEELKATIHGETFHIRIQGAGHVSDGQRPVYVTVDGVPEEIQLEVLSEWQPQGQARAGDVAQQGPPRASGPGDVTAAIPSTVVEVKVKPGDRVKAGDPVVITEAMKMETEIQAPIAGVVSEVFVSKGDSVNPDDALLRIAREGE